jgi:hypothetical protein
MDLEAVNPALRVLDDQLVDADGRRFGRIDDIELDGRPGAETRVGALIVGAGAWRWRVPARLAGITAPPTPQIVRRVPWQLVRSIEPGVVRIATAMGELGSGTGHHAAARWGDELDRGTFRLSSLLGARVQAPDGRPLGDARSAGRSGRRRPHADAAAVTTWRCFGGGSRCWLARPAPRRTRGLPQVTSGTKRHKFRPVAGRRMSDVPDEDRRIAREGRQRRMPPGAARIVVGRLEAASVLADDEKQQRCLTIASCRIEARRAVRGVVRGLLGWTSRSSLAAARRAGGIAARTLAMPPRLAAHVRVCPRPMHPSRWLLDQGQRQVEALTYSPLAGGTATGRSPPHSA